jgi:predicted enzyme related to lactoylglutathione lyase
MSVQLKTGNESKTQTFEWAGLACVYVPTKDVVSAADWYHRVLGMKVALVEPGSHAMLSMPGMGMFLVHTDIESTINYYKQEAGAPQAAWCFKVKHIEALYSHMTANAVQMTELTDRDDCGINFQFYDPDGNYFDVNDDHRIFVPLRKADNEETLMSLLKRKLGSKEPLTDWATVSDALAKSGRLPCRIVLHGWETFRSGLPGHAAHLLQRLEKHNEDHPDQRAEIICR